MDELNIRLIIEYDGTNYHGWQRQANAITVQETLENAIERMTQEKVTTIAAGRTDTGVHARGQVVNFKLHKKLALAKIRPGINSYLPDDIVVKKADQVPLDFNARFDARKRIYQYFLSLERTAIFRKYSWEYFHKINFEDLQEISALLLGEHDFSAFVKYQAQQEQKVCFVHESFWRKESMFMIYRIEANRFLHGMVRGLVGTMLDVARGRFTLKQFKQIFESKDRTRAGVAAPAHGLFLEEVFYN
jgi:tRNA pseudouridine38-40 synthase